MRNAKEIPSVLGYNTKALWDPVQTNAVYGVPVYDVDRVKNNLKETYKATRFRIVQSHVKDIMIVCCKIPQ